MCFNSNKNIFLELVNPNFDQCRWKRYDSSLRILRDSIIEFLHIIRSQGESMAKELSLAQAEDLEVLLESLKGDSERYLGQMGACQKRQFFVAQSFDTGFDKQLLTKLQK